MNPKKKKKKSDEVDQQAGDSGRTLRSISWQNIFLVRKGQSLFYLVLQLVRCPPPTVDGIVLYSKSTDLNVSLIQKISAQKHL